MRLFGVKKQFLVEATIFLEGRDLNDAKEKADSIDLERATYLQQRAECVLEVIEDNVIGSDI